ncbi:MAG: ABC transporter permease [Firmicutes bacterium]|nr:ABC transporter permease [Bacillota bacterium]
MWVMARFVWREAWRRRLVPAALILAVVYVSLFRLGLDHLLQRTAEGLGRPFVRLYLVAFMLVFALYGASLMVSVVTILASVGAISGEIDSGILQPIVARPVRRWEIVGGKYLGYGALLVLLSLTMAWSLVVIGMDRLGPGFWGQVLWDVTPSFALTPLVVLAVTLLGSVLLPTLGNGIAVFGLFSVAFIGGAMGQIGAMVQNRWVYQIGRLSTFVLPSDGLYWAAARRVVETLSEAAASGGAGGVGPGAALGPQGRPMSGYDLSQMMGPFGASAPQPPWFLAYAAAFAGVVLLLAMLAMERRRL